MGEVQSALDALAADDLHGMGDGDVLARVAELVAMQNRSLPSWSAPCGTPT